MQITTNSPLSDQSPLLQSTQNKNPNHQSGCSKWSKKEIALKSLGALLGAGVFVGQEILASELAGIQTGKLGNLILISISGAIVGISTDVFFKNYPLKQRAVLNLISSSGIINLVQSALAGTCLLTSKFPTDAICQADLLPYMCSSTLVIMSEAAIHLAAYKKSKQSEDNKINSRVTLNILGQSTSSKDEIGD